MLNPLLALSPLQAVTLPYVLLGLCFAAGAVYLQATRTFALSELKTDEPALKIGYDKFSLQTVYPVIALYVIAAFCAVGIPGYYIFTGAHADPSIVVDFPVQPSGIPLSVALAGHDANSDEGVELPLCRTDVPQKYQLLSPLYKPVTLEFAFDDATGAVTLKNLSVPSKPKSLALNGHALSLNDPIVLEPAEQAPVAAVQDVPTTPINAPEPADLQPPEKL